MENHLDPLYTQEKIIMITNKMEISTTDVTAVPLDEQIQKMWEEKVTKHKIPCLWCEAGLQVRKQLSHVLCYLGKQLFLKAPKGSSDHIQTS